MSWYLLCLFLLPLRIKADLLRSFISHVLAVSSSIFLGLSELLFPLGFHSLIILTNLGWFFCPLPNYHGFSFQVIQIMRVKLCFSDFCDTLLELPICVKSHICLVFVLLHSRQYMCTVLTITLYILAVVFFVNFLSLHIKMCIRDRT